MVGWYVMHSKPQKEQWLYDQLCAQEIQAYYPCLQIKYGKPCSHRPKPYFPGYLFVNVDIEQISRSVLQWLPGSLGLVAFGGEPACVPDGLLQSIRQHVDEMNNAEDTLWNFLKSGDKVTIHSGPFAGYEAVFCRRLRDSQRVQVFLKILQDHTIQVNLPVDQITTTKQNSALL